ncbi:MAG: class I SAM-dependent methyltransferase [Acidobacteriota bacterium]
MTGRQNIGEQGSSGHGKQHGAPSEARFAFGRNWRAFLERVDEERVKAAEDSMVRLLGRQRLDGLELLDIGCGSGLFSLAARRLGARVTSFDYDADSVACTRELRRRFAPEDAPEELRNAGAQGVHGDGAEPEGPWRVERGSVLDESYLESLGTFDLVYSWGVLHHTGEMWRALDGAGARVAPEGSLCIAIYNQQPVWTPVWKRVKRLYNRGPKPLSWVLAVGWFLFTSSAMAVFDSLRGKNPFDRHSRAGKRGMNHWHDVKDWVGGWPFEAAKPEEIFEFFRRRGYELRGLSTCGGRHGCNEFLFQRAEGGSGEAGVAEAGR